MILGRHWGPSLVLPSNGQAFCLITYNCSSSAHSDFTDRSYQSRPDCNRTKMSDILQEVWERTLPLSFCQEVYNQSFRISYSQFCSRAINAYGPCWGDTGDLLMVNNTLYGLLSWNGGCFFKAAPSIFTQISSVRHWIFQVMKNYHPRQNSPNNVTLPKTSD
ncbi:hypothetical protein J6590_098116 [Homalodisca vitripennis]|nr:hypothetical protein J6590_100063 [Homalodisca vitripennis]KAG8334061.1 hypothetical protein J6590_098116 [Homalodisca vitripennis]